MYKADINSIKKNQIDLSLLGFNINGAFECYYCTPKDARISGFCIGRQNFGAASSLVSVKV